MEKSSEIDIIITIKLILFTRFSHLSAGFDVMTQVASEPAHAPIKNRPNPRLSMSRMFMN